MPFDDLTNQLVSQARATQQALSRSATLSVDTDPDKHAANRKKAVAAGMPVSLADSAKKPATADDLHARLTSYHALQDTSPITAKHVSNPEVAKMADHGNMAKTEGLFKTFRNFVEGDFADVAGTVGSMLSSYARQAVEG